MIGFLRWARSIGMGMLNVTIGAILFVVLLIGVLAIYGAARGDGLPGNMVLALDLRGPIQDSVVSSPLDFGPPPLTVMDVILALDHAQHDSRVKGVLMRVGSGDLSVAQAEEIGAALKRFRAQGKFVIAHSQGFQSTGLGDYMLATDAGQIWMQPKSVFGPSGAGAGAVFLKGFFDKIDADPQIAKRSDFKSAADMFMEKDYTAPDRLQTTALLNSWVQTATATAAADRKMAASAVSAAFDNSPQFAGEAKAAGLIDKIGYDDDAQDAAERQAGYGSKTVAMRAYIKATRASLSAGGPRIALIAGEGEIVDGTAGGGIDGGGVIAGDDFAAAIRAATKDSTIKAIVLRVDSPGGSVTASDQILEAVKKARAAGKPVVVSMGGVAASGGYYIACDADRIVAEPGTITGSIGVLTGKVSVGKSLALLGITADEIGVGKNALFDSAISPYTDQQWAALNHQADVIYADFTQKVSEGRKLPLADVQAIAKGRVWSGADAKPIKLVDELGGFWTAVAAAKKLAGIEAASPVSFIRYPRPKGFFGALNAMFGDSAQGLEVLARVQALADTPPMRMVGRALAETPRGGVQLLAPGLPN